MTTKLLLWLSLAIKLLSVVSFAGSLPALALLPAEYMAFATLAFGLASILKDTCNRLGDLLDDGQLNQSFKALALFLLPMFLLSGCAGGLFLGLDKAAWNDVIKDTANGALKGATQSALPAYVKARSAKEARKVTP